MKLKKEMLKTLHKLMNNNNLERLLEKNNFTLNGKLTEKGVELHELVIKTVKGRTK